jgi:hypothetical protein
LTLLMHRDALSPFVDSVVMDSRCADWARARE